MGRMEHEGSCIGALAGSYCFAHKSTVASWGFVSALDHMADSTALPCAKGSPCLGSAGKRGRGRMGVKGGPTPRWRYP